MLPGGGNGDEKSPTKLRKMYAALRVLPLIWASGFKNESDGWCPGFNGFCWHAEEILQKRKKAG